MNRNFIFVFILLATLLTINAVPTQLRKRVTLFEPCPETTVPLEVSNVVPDPIIAGARATFDISGKLPKAITTGSMLNVYFYELSTGTPILLGSIAEGRGLPICAPEPGVLECPYAAKTPFSVSMYGPAPANLPK